MGEMKMIAWKKICSGEYISKDERFWAVWSYDRVYGDHWVLHDMSVDDFYKRQYHEKTLKECKVMAERIVNPPKPLLPNEIAF